MCFCGILVDFLLSLNSIPLYGYTTFGLSIHPLMDTHIISAFWLLGESFRELASCFPTPVLIITVYVQGTEVTRLHQCPPQELLPCTVPPHPSQLSSPELTPGATGFHSDPVSVICERQSAGVT